MSVAAVATVWERSLRAKGSELLVLLAIADYAHDDGRDAWPSIVTLARKSRMTERGVYGVIQRLVDAGELRVEKNADGREVRGGHRPRQFFHVLCCAREPEKISGSGGRGNRKRFPVKPEKSSGSEPEKISGETGTAVHSEPEPPCKALKEDPLEIHQGSISGGVRGRRSHPLDEPAVLEPWSLDAFEQLWAIYPEQTNRLGALRAWHALHPSQELAAFIVAHVKTRIASGWGREVPGIFAPRPPFLARFLEECRWQERYVPPRPASASTAAVDGQLVMRSCPGGCGAVLEGCVTNGQEVYPPCSRCAPAGQTSDQARARVM